MNISFPNLRHLRVFLEVAKTGSISIAAQNCHLSQPAASQAISQLETNLQTPLLIRRREKFIPTQCGEAFQTRVHAALNHIKEGANAALSTAGFSAKKQRFDHLITAAQLRNLIAIAQYGSFTLAAKNLGISQPTIHRAARNLEAVSSIPLFDVSPTGIRLTQAAEALVKGAKLALSEIRQSYEEISNILGEDKGLFIIGSLPLARTSILPKSIHAMVSETKNVQIRVIDGRYHELLQALRLGDLDCLIGALRFPVPTDDIEQKTLFIDELAIVAHPSHPLCQKAHVDLEDTMAYPWVAPPKDTPAGQYLFKTLRMNERKYTPVRVVSSSMMTLRGMLEQGSYISIVSRHQIAIDQQLGLIKTLNVPLQDHHREIGLTYRKDWRPTQMQARFIDFLHEYSASDSRFHEVKNI